MTLGLIGGAGFGEAFGATIRKVLDTRYSVLLFNVCRLVPDEIYAEFCRHVIAAHPDGEITAASLKTAFQSFYGAAPSGEFADWMMEPGRQDRRYATVFYYWRNLFKAAVFCMPDEDLEAMAAAFREDWTL